MDEVENQDELFEQQISIFLSHCLHQAAGLKHFNELLFWVDANWNVAQETTCFFGSIYTRKAIVCMIMGKHLHISHHSTYASPKIELDYLEARRICVIEVIHHSGVLLPWINGHFLEGDSRMQRSSMLHSPKDTSCSKKVAFWQETWV